MAAYDYDYLGDLLKKVGGLMTQYDLSSGFMFDDNVTKVLSITTRDGPELTSLYYNENLYYGEQTIIEVGVYYRYGSTNVTGRAIYSEEGLSDVWAEEAYMTINSVITFTR